MGNMLITFEIEDTELDPDDPWNGFQQACDFSTRSTFHTTQQASQGQLVFGRETINDIPFEANWDRIKSNKEKCIARSNKRENSNGIKHKYNVGDSIILKKPGLRRKISTPKEGI
jgi:hypothetical protein